MGKISIAKVKC